MNDSGAVHARLKAHGLLDEAMEIVSRHACGVGVPSPAARADLVAMMEKRGWSAANALRLLGVPVDVAIPPPPKSVRRVVGRPRSKKAPAPPKPPKGRTGDLSVVGSWAETRSSRSIRLVEDEELEALETSEPIIVPLEKGQRRRTIGGKIFEVISPRTPGGRALVRYASGNLLEVSIPVVEASPLVRPEDVERHRLALVDRPRLYPGPGERFDGCVNYSDCLDRLMQAVGRSSPTTAHCPKGCKHHRELTRTERIGLSATTRTRSVFDGT